MFQANAIDLRMQALRKSRLAFLACIVGILFQPREACSFYTYNEVTVENSESFPELRVKTFTTATNVTYYVALLKSSTKGQYWTSSLNLSDGTNLFASTTSLLGEDIRRALPEVTLAKWGWNNFVNGAQLIRFTVSTQLVATSRFTWSSGPESNERGIPYGGGTVNSGTLKVFMAISLKPNTTEARRQPVSDHLRSTSSTLVFRHRKFGLRFILPESWKGYQVLSDQWAGYGGSGIVENGPVIVLRHPQWKKEKPTLDIPIRIYQRKQWLDYLDGKFQLSASGYEMQLGHTEKFVFAIPREYNANIRLEHWKETTQCVEDNLGRSQEESTR